VTYAGETAVRNEYAAMCELLERQSAAQGELLSLSHDKRRAIIACDTASLGEISSKEMRLISRASAIERERAALMPGTAALLGIDAAEITLGVMAERGEPDEAARLRALHRELTETINSLRQSNRLCGELLNTQLDYTDAMLGAMAQGQGEDALNNYYGMDGRAILTDNSRRGFFDGLA
jgi:flagellar biosynthesis/type III secretory pathway chaperone